MALSVGGHVQRAEQAPLQDYYRDEFRKVDAGGIAAANREDYAGDIKSGSLFARMDLGQDLTLGFYRHSFRSLTSTGDPPATALYLDDSRWLTTSDTVSGKYRFNLAATLKGELVVDYSRMEVDPQAKYNNSYNNFTNGYSYVLGERLGIEQNLNWQLSDTHTVQAGFGYQKHYAIETASLPARYDTDRGPSSQGYQYPNTNLPLQIHDASFENYSGYVQLQSEWNAEFSSMAGVRIDRHTDYGQTINPRLGAVWRVNAQHVLKALYGEAFRAPSPEEYLSSFGSFDGSLSNGLYRGYGFRVPNFDLEPEKVKTVSLTWDWRPRQDVNLVANVYHSRIENLIVTQPSVSVDAIPGAILVNPETKGNAGFQKQHGLDLIAQWRFRLNPAWSGDFWGSASWLRGRIEEGDGVEWEISHVADRKLKLGATFRYYDWLTISPQIQAIGVTTNGRKRPPAASLQLQQDCTQVMLAPERCRTDGYVIANLHLGWHKLLDGKATLWLDIYNLFDKRYSAAHGSGSRTFWDMPQPPRRWMASLEYRF
jgi:outer membrane receptor protein involved in Fe transport